MSSCWLSSVSLASFLRWLFCFPSTIILPFQRCLMRDNKLMVLFSLQEPAWVRANRAKHTTQAQDMCSKKLLRTISGGDKTFREGKKLEWCLSSLLFTSLPLQHERKKAYAGLSFYCLSFPWLNCILRRDFALIDLFIFPLLCL